MMKFSASSGDNTLKYISRWLDSCLSQEEDIAKAFPHRFSIRTGLKKKSYSLKTLHTSCRDRSPQGYAKSSFNILAEFINAGIE